MPEGEAPLLPLPGEADPQFIDAVDPFAGMRERESSPGFDDSGPDPYAGVRERESGQGFSGQGAPERELTGALDEYALDALRTPSRYDIPLVQQGTELIDRELADQQGQATRDMDEYFSGRGLVGSNVEAEERGRLAEGFEGQRMQRLFDLNRELAGTQAQDRASAGSLGSQIHGQAQQESQFERGLSQQESQFARTHGLNEDQFLESTRRFGVQMDEQISGRYQQEAQFARSHGLNEDAFRENQRQFSTQMSEQIASRMQQENQFARSLNQQETQLALQSQLQTRALNLQEQGMTMQDAFQRAQLEVETQLQTRALELEQTGMEMEDAYRYAALEQDGSFRQRAQELQAQGMEMDAAYRGAELGYRQWATKQGLIQDRYKTQEASRLAELDILHRAQAAGIEVDLPDLGNPGAPPIDPPPPRGPQDTGPPRRQTT